MNEIEMRARREGDDDDDDDDLTATLRRGKARSGNGWNIDTSGARRTLYLPVPAPGFLYDLYTSSSPLPCLNFVCKVIYIRGGHLGTTFDWQEITRPTRESEFVRSFRWKCYFYRSPHPSNNSMESPPRGIPNRSISYYLTKHRIRTFAQNRNRETCFSPSSFFLGYIILNFHPDILPMEQCWIQRDKLTK